jgi:hypothetical protein
MRHQGHQQQQPAAVTPGVRGCLRHFAFEQAT